MASFLSLSTLVVLIELTLRVLPNRVGFEELPKFAAQVVRILYLPFWTLLGAGCLYAAIGNAKETLLVAGVALLALSFIRLAILKTPRIHTAKFWLSPNECAILASFVGAAVLCMNSAGLEAHLDPSLQIIATEFIWRDALILCFLVVCFALSSYVFWMLRVTSLFETPQNRSGVPNNIQWDSGYPRSRVKVRRLLALLPFVGFLAVVVVGHALKSLPASSLQSQSPSLSVMACVVFCFVLLVWRLCISRPTMISSLHVSRFLLLNSPVLQELLKNRPGDVPLRVEIAKAIYCDAVLRLYDSQFSLRRHLTFVFVAHAPIALSAIALLILPVWGGPLEEDQIASLALSGVLWGVLSVSFFFARNEEIRNHLLSKTNVRLGDNPPFAFIYDCRALHPLARAGARSVELSTTAVVYFSSLTIAVPLYLQYLSAFAK
jgi:hypothetical protein